VDLDCLSGTDSFAATAFVAFVFVGNFAYIVFIQKKNLFRAEFDAGHSLCTASRQQSQSCSLIAFLPNESRLSNSGSIQRWYEWGKRGSNAYESSHQKNACFITHIMELAVVQEDRK